MVVTGHQITADRGGAGLGPTLTQTNLATIYIFNLLNELVVIDQ